MAFAISAPNLTASLPDVEDLLLDVYRKDMMSGTEMVQLACMRVPARYRILTLCLQCNATGRFLVSCCKLPGSLS